MKLGDWVHCTRCIRKTGNHYEVIPAGNTTDSTETALYFEHGAEENAEEHAADQHFRWSACRKGDKETMKHCPCEGCKNSIGGVSTFNNCAGELDKRVRSIPGAYRDYRMIQSVAEKLVRKLLTTVPKNKLVQISKELKYTRIVVEVKPEITPSRDDGNLLTYVPQRALERIMEKVVGYECFCCEKAGKDARRCQLRRDIEATYHYDYPDDGKNARLPE